MERFTTVLSRRYLKLTEGTGSRHPMAFLATDKTTIPCIRISGESAPPLSVALAGSCNAFPLRTNIISQPSSQG